MKLWQDFKEYKNFSNQSLLALVLNYIILSSCIA